ncbi:MAG TPA: hypothetical protein VJ124_00070 [Pyrinomonadaceae bacterium]|nr:hypothetical protein [Pyrinomonadaceae bacterium]
MSNKAYIYLGLSILAISLTNALPVQGQQSGKKHCAMTHKHIDAINARGDKEMGFEHLKTTHHFLLASDGGAIQVEANDANDKQSRDQIRQHLQHIATMFADGNFNTPTVIHAQAPPGTELMKQLKSEISYQFRETPRGATVRITTRNPNALQAIHDFLRFQIKEHMTGDSLEIVPVR